MAHATGSRRRIIYGPETTAGTLATAGILMRNTGDSLNLTKNTIQSGELTGDRAIRFLRHGNEAVGGDISFELAYGAFDDFLEAVLAGEWSSANPSLTGTLVQYRPGVDRVGESAVPTFSFEKGFQDIAQYLAYRGCAINTFSIDIATDSVVTGSIGIVGMGVGQTDAPEAGYTETSYLAGTPVDTWSETEPFTSFDGTITLAGGSGCVITALNISIDNGITANYSVCGPEAQSVTPDRINVTGTVTALFADAVELNKFIEEDTSSIEVTLVDPEGNSLAIELPKIKYTGGDVPVSGGGVISISLPFQALYGDTTTPSSIKFTRTKAV